MAQSRPWPKEYAAVRELLLRAAGFAESLQRSRWDFAVEISELLQLGLSRADLRWLVCQGLIEHRGEVVCSDSGNRAFQDAGELSFNRRTCFIITSLGQEGACLLNSRQVSGGGMQSVPADNTGWKAKVPSPSMACILPDKPLWNMQLSKLLFGNLVVKEYRAPAPNQHRILAAFEEDLWCPRIDDPLPPAAGIDQKKRLHDTICALNRHHVNRVMRFSGDGSGSGIRWFPLLERQVIVHASAGLEHDIE